MHNEQRARAHDLLRSRGLDRAIFADPASVAWLTGFAPPLQTGPSPFAGGPPLVWYSGGEFTLVVMEGLDTSTITVPVVRYSGYTVETPLRGPEHLARIVSDLATGPAVGTVGVEARHLPAALLPADARPIDGLIQPLRMVKSAAELVALRRAFALTDLAHAAARAATRARAREIDVWTAAHSALQQAAGARMPFGNDCVVSYRENNIGGWPADLPLRPGDSLMVDLGTRVDGYWSDSCATYYAAAPTNRQIAMHRAAEQALAFAIGLVKPGVRANAVDHQVRQFVADLGYPVYPHHTGHAVGVSPHEAPRLVPYDETVLAAGMVLMLEPGIYFPREAAVRLEDAVLVTADGAEVLTHHAKGLPA